jgi:hypothetical protein
MTKRVDELMEEVTSGFEINANNVLEIKIIDRINDTVKVLNR